MSLREWWARCKRWRLGPFMTEWQCLLPRKHKGDHVFEPDLWQRGGSPEERRQALQDRITDDARVAATRKTNDQAR